MNRTPQEKFVLLFETAKRSLLASEMLLSRMSVDLTALEPDIGASINIGSRAISPLLSAVAFIDFSHRFGSVVDALPLINKTAPEMRRLRLSLTPVEIARNHLQHMRGDLSSNMPIEYPLLGSLAWANGNSSYAIFLSQPTKTDAHSLVYDTHNRCWVAQRQYTVKDAAINLDVVLGEMRAAYDWIASLAQLPVSALAKLEWGETFAMGFHVRSSAKEV
jgi:hypothetical protein